MQANEAGLIRHLRMLYDMESSVYQQKEFIKKLLAMNTPSHHPRPQTEESPFLNGRKSWPSAWSLYLSQSLSYFYLLNIGQTQFRLFACWPAWFVFTIRLPESRRTSGMSNNGKPTMRVEEHMLRL